MKPLVLDPGVALNFQAARLSAEHFLAAGFRLAVTPDADFYSIRLNRADAYLAYLCMCAEDEARAAVEAEHHAAVLATDAPSLRRLFEGRGGESLSTATLVQGLTDGGELSPAVVAGLPGRISREAAFMPLPCDPAYAWWMQATTSSPS